MAQKAEFGYVDILLLGLVLSLAAGLRTGYLVRLADNASGPGVYRVQDSPPPLPEGMTARGQAKPTSMDLLVDNQQRHDLFATVAPLSGDKEEVTAHVAPGYPWMLATIGRYVEAGKVDAVVRWLQCALGSLTAALYFIVALRGFGSRTVALLAGLFCAVHPFWIISTAEINDGVLASFLLAVVCTAGVHVRSSGVGGAFASLVFGLSLAGLCLVRAAFLPFAFAGILWFLLHCSRLERGWLCALLGFLGFVNGLIPWSLRNYKVFHEPVPIVSSAWLHLYAGSNSRANGGPQSDAELIEALAQQRGQSVTTVKEQLQSTGQVRRYRNLAEPTVNTVRDQPADALRHRFEAAGSFLLGRQGLREGRLGQTTPGTREVPEWMSRSHEAVLQGTLLAMFVLALLGWRWSLNWRRDALPTSLALIWVPLPYLLSHAAELHGPRLPLDGVLLVYAAFGLVAMVPGLNGYLLGGPDKAVAAPPPPPTAPYYPGLAR